MHNNCAERRTIRGSEKSVSKNTQDVHSRSSPLDTLTLVRFMRWPVSLDAEPSTSSAECQNRRSQPPVLLLATELVITNHLKYI